MVAYLSKKGNHQGIRLIIKTFKIKLNIKLLGQNLRSFFVKLQLLKSKLETLNRKLTCGRQL